MLAEKAMAKNRLKVGEEILKLKKMFPNDRILRKILLDEFKETRMAKFPLRGRVNQPSSLYDVFDSDDENAIKKRQSSDIQDFHRNKSSIPEFVYKDILKERQFATLYMQDMEKFEGDKLEEMNKEK